MTPTYQAGITDLEIKTIVLFPNPWPGADNITVRYSLKGAADSVTAEIFTMGLRKVAEEKAINPGSEEMAVRAETLDNFASGYYLYRLRAEASGKKVWSMPGIFIILNK